MDGYDKQSGTTVMVVDDVSASRYAMGAVLRRAGHDVVPVASAGEALSELDVRLRAGALPDVALVDVGLPDMNGFELCRRVKSRPSTAALPVVHFSAMALEPVDRCRGLDAGADAYLTVPAEPSEIQAVVRAAVRGARRGAAAETVAHRLTVLSEAIVAVQTARCLGELADAAAAGAARLVGAPAVVFVIGPDGETHCGTSRSRLALPDASAQEAAARLITRIGEGWGGRTGVHSTVVPAPLWPAGFFQPGVNEDARLVLASAQEGRAQVCIATPACAASPRGAGNCATSHNEPADDRRPSEALPLAALPAERLAQATALAAEPLLMYQAERDIALTLQHSFLPQPHRLPHLPGVDLVVRYVPASRQAEIGGDFYAALRTEEGVLTVVGDVVGHSLEAATVMVEMRHALRAHCVEESDPRALAERLDRMLQHYHPDVTATVCLALVDPGTGRVRIANAGHIPPLIVGEEGKAEYVPVDGPLLGLALDRPTPSELVMAPQDRLLMVTDGLIETRGIDLATSMEQLRTAAADAPAGLDPLCDTLLGCFGRDREDDIAMLALRLG
ncbi:Serine phosphatase RsbU, regulator of sigma subunit [Streptomyces sp. cf386]|uniref:fused response regulator/phosphatase n=1 Tax=Streptomyces sp. cf386 TaxID=1761904 RepID=UPI00088DE546|nr:fused response regulator/phosphatase [Streptomyces sp. cf386]SDO26510.1 Serine phosphatase RsbU, regulator of sigma subunit [Streptomyces sp. cf386]